MQVGVSSRVSARDDLGRFRTECSNAAAKTIERAIADGAQMSRELAPVGHKADPRTIPLADSITYTMDSRTSGHWEASARHALPIELGAVPHDLPVNVRFYWESEGRMWDPAPRWPGQVIKHPGNGPQPYLRPAYEATMARIMKIAKRYYPGG